MNKKEIVTFAVLNLSVLVDVVLAQPGRIQETAACGACGAGLGAIILFPIVVIALNIALLVWVARDARDRGMNSSVGWIFLVFFTSLIGLIIYIFSRPKGNLIQCSSCNNKRLKVSSKCPHCGNA